MSKANGNRQLLSSTIQNSWMGMKTIDMSRHIDLAMTACDLIRQIHKYRKSNTWWVAIIMQYSFVSQLLNTIVQASGYSLPYLVSSFCRFIKYVSYFLGLHSSNTPPNVMMVSYIAIQTSDKIFRKQKQTAVTYRSWTSAFAQCFCNIGSLEHTRGVSTLLYFPDI